MTRCCNRNSFAFFRYTLAIITIYCVSNSYAVAQPFAAKHLQQLHFRQLTGGIVIINAKLDTFSNTLNFILDTGSGGISLDSTTTAELNIVYMPSRKIIRGLGGIKEIAFTNNHILQLGSLQVDSLDFHINDYSLLSSVYGIRIDGIIGYSFLKRFIVTIDYEQHLIDIYTPGKYQYPKGGSLLFPTFANLPMQYVEITNQHRSGSNFYFDIGAGICMLLSQQFVDDKKLHYKKYNLYSSIAEGIGGKTNVTLTVLKKMKVDKYTFKNVPVYIFNDEYNLTYYPKVGGLLGNDIMRRFNIVLNYPQQQIHIKPNLNYNDLFDYSYSGLSIYMIEGKITISDIIKNSPGDKAGLKENDVIISVGKDFSNNIQTYKALLQNSHSLSIIVMRNGELHTHTISILNIKKGR